MACAACRYCRFVFVPIVDQGHWSLAVFCSLGMFQEPPPASREAGTATSAADTADSSRAPCLVFMDPLDIHRVGDVRDQLRLYIESEWRVKRAKRAALAGAAAAEEKKEAACALLVAKALAELPVVMPPVPKQRNHCDCGLFVLHRVREVSLGILA